MSSQPISHYEILEKLGEGGMGVVWKARDTRLGRFAALKFLPAAKLADPESKRRFVQEAKATSALNHPNIVTLYEIGSDSGADFIAMELVAGKPLDRIIRHKGLSLHDALDYAIQIADALTTAHMAGIVHRDLKPGNIMITESGRVKVLDFGLAKLAGTNAPMEQFLTRTVAEAANSSAGMILGTPSYMSPEQAEGKPIDARTDIFSFGAVLYEMITRQRAFGGDSIASTMSAILRDQPKPAREISPGLPREVDRILDRCLEKDPGRRYQHAGDLKLDLEEVRDDLVTGASRDSGTAHAVQRRRWLWLIAACVCLAVPAVAWLAFRGTGSKPVMGRITRITNDSGLSRFPALSPDGKLIAYSADNGSDDDQDLYVRQIGGGQPVRITKDGAANIMPDFSPDGTKIVFRSNHNGGGIFEIPAFGGDARLIVRNGLYPKYSPDGSQIAYSIGSENVSVSVPGSGTIWVASVGGGEPRQVGRQFTGARYPIWSPDGKHLLSIGYTASKAYEGSNEDWWLVPVDGGEPIKTGVYEVLMKTGLRPRGTVMETGPRPACWANDNHVVFSTAVGDANSLWQIAISPRTGKVAGPLKRLTTGGGNEQDASCAAGGALAFASLDLVRNVWTLPYNLDRGKAAGQIRRVTESPAFRQYVSLSANGRYLTFASDQGGRSSIWMRDLDTGKETRVTTGTFRQNWPSVSPSGRRVAYSSIEKDDQRYIYVTTPGGVPEKLCEGCLRATGWSHDEKAVLDFGGNPYHINLLDVESHKQTLLIKPTTNNLVYARFSPDDRWISFTVRLAANHGRIMVANVTGARPVPESLWIPIADVDVDEWAEWSPDGNTLYFSSAKDGYSCFWGQRLDPKSRRPAGDPFAVLHLHGRLSYGHRGWSSGGNRIAMVLSENRGNIWLMSRSE